MVPSILDLSWLTLSLHLMGYLLIFIYNGLPYYIGGPQNQPAIMPPQQVMAGQGPTGNNQAVPSGSLTRFKVHLVKRLQAKPLQNSCHPLNCVKSFSALFSQKDHCKTTCLNHPGL
ncbi:hypothetical protein cypCar_00011002 [Cyprinus carpio]|nr:hypothetical protein cypCar_00011002 [Cyprinus carpio]